MLQPWQRRRGFKVHGAVQSVAADKSAAPSCRLIGFWGEPAVD